MSHSILTEILKRFSTYLEEFPANLRLMCHSLLFFLIAIEIALTIYNNIDNPQFQYLKWAKTKILRIGFIIFAINKYEWLMSGIKSFFFYAVEKAVRTPIVSGEYFEDPSLIYEKGSDLAAVMFEQVSIHPKTYIYAAFGFLILFGFLLLTIQIILCWIEFYFLTGFSIIFLPFGALDIGTELYKNVFKTIMSCSIKLGVMNLWILLASVIINNLFKLTLGSITFKLVGVIVGTIYVLVAIIAFLPSLASSLLTGSPVLNANAAMSAAIGAGAALATNAYHTARMGGKAGTELGSSISKRTEQGGQKGAIYGAKLGGPVGAIVGSWVGAGVGALGGAIEGGFKGAYAAGRYGINQGLLRKPEYGANTKEKKENSKSNPANTVNSKNAESKNPQTMNTGSARSEDTNATDVLRELQSEQGPKNTANTGTQPIVNGEQGVPSWMQ